jgi:hypothetical protein
MMDPETEMVGPSGTVACGALEGMKGPSTQCYLLG